MTNKIAEIKIQKYKEINQYIASLQQWSEANEPKKLHQELQKLFKLKNPSPIMTTLWNEQENRAAKENEIEEIIGTYLKNKFTTD